MMLLRLTSRAQSSELKTIIFSAKCDEALLPAPSRRSLDLLDRLYGWTARMKGLIEGWE